MFDHSYPSLNKFRPPLHKYDGNPNKQNSDHENELISCVTLQKFTSFSQEQMKSLEILKESALAALIEKQQIIESLTFCNHEELVWEIEQLTVRVKELEMQNTELRATLEEAMSALYEEKHEWNQQRFKLIEEIDSLKDALSNFQASAEQTLQKNGQLLLENQQIWQEMTQLQTAYKVARQQLQHREEEKSEQLFQKINSERIIVNDMSQKSGKARLEGTEKYSYEKVRFVEEFAQKNLHGVQRQNDQNENYREILSYETQEWLEEPSIANSIPEQHCLGRSLKAINLIDNYSINSKNKVISDSQSQFTSKYFKYTNEHHFAAFDKTLQDSCQHIPEEPEEELLISEHRIEKGINQSSPYSVWWERIAFLATGVCSGAYLVWRWKK